MAESRRRRYLRYAAFVLLFVFLLSAGFFLVEQWEKGEWPFHSAKNVKTSASEDEVVYVDGQEYVLKDNIETLLVLGLDKFDGTGESDSYNNNRQADFLMLFVIDNENETCTALHINRDTMAEINVLGVAGDKVGTTTQQIALAHTYGNGKEVSCRNAANAVSKLLMNIKIDHYVSVTMDAVEEYTDLIGGVEVTVLDDFTGIDDTLVKGETVTLHGEHALNYVRTRYGLEDSTNETRMTRQRQFLEALYRKTQQREATEDGFIAGAFLQLSEYVVSDRSVNYLQTFFEKIAAYELQEIRGLEGETVMGEEHIEFYPDTNSLIQVVAELFYEPKEK